MKKVKDLFMMIALFVLFSVVYVSFVVANPPSINSAINDSDSYIFGAHRGNSVDFIENTFLAIESSILDDKYSFVEFDIQYTKDKEIILLHDRTFYVDGVKKSVGELSKKELEEIVGYSIPIYEDIMKMINGKKSIVIEIKSHGNLEEDKELVDFVIEDLKERKILDKTCLISISGDVVKYVNENYSEVKNGKVYWVIAPGIFPVDFVIEDFYQEIEEIGADYIFIYGSNYRYDKYLEENKPDDVKICYWYFTDEIYVFDKEFLR